MASWVEPWTAWFTQTPEAKRQKHADVFTTPDMPQQGVVHVKEPWDLMRRQSQLEALPIESQELIAELFRIISGEDEVCGVDDTVLDRDPGHEKTASQRQNDCERVAVILGLGAEGVNASLRWVYGETLVHLALEYDHRHAPEMLLTVLKAGADPNSPNAMDGERPLESPWLEHEEDSHVSQKRACLCRFGARTISVSRTQRQ